MLFVGAALHLVGGRSDGSVCSGPSSLDGGVGSGLSYLHMYLSKPKEDAEPMT